jgi:hypothetical protein
MAVLFERLYGAAAQVPLACSADPGSRPTIILSDSASNDGCICLSNNADECALRGVAGAVAECVEMA